MVSEPTDHRHWTSEEAFQVRCRSFVVRNLRIIGDSGIGKIGERVVGSAVILIHTIKYNSVKEQK